MVRTIATKVENRARYISKTFQAVKIVLMGLIDYGYLTAVMERQKVIL